MFTIFAVRSFYMNLTGPKVRRKNLNLVMKMRFSELIHLGLVISTVDEKNMVSSYNEWDDILDECKFISFLSLSHSTPFK